MKDANCNSIALPVFCALRARYIDAAGRLRAAAPEDLHAYNLGNL